MRRPPFGTVEFGGHLVGFETPVTSKGGGLAAIGRHFRSGHRREPLRDLQVLLQHPHRVDPADGRRDRQAHRVAQRIVDRHRASACTACRRRRGSSCRWRRCRGGAAPAARAARSCGSVASKPFSGSWQLSNGNPCSSIAEVNRGILVAGEADVAHLALRLRAIERLEDAARARNAARDRCRTMHS